ncbi:MAG: glycosyltransferase family 2 protein [Planctomycetota bacterium]|nr:MAG: glycosyltransferase family 2 protein [Planctomycetota bacterium]
MFSKLTILIPVYNEERTIANLLDIIQKVELIENIQKEIIIVNDGSTDNTESVIQDYQNQNPELGIRYIPMEKNQGKGAAIRRGLEEATGEFVIIQDADLEYDPREYNILIKPIVDGFADVVYGSRFMGGRPHRILFFWHSIGNKILTFISNMFSDLNLTDMETGFKVIRTEYLRKINLQERSFGFEPEVTAKLAKIPGIRIYEVGISYYGRTYAEGKKINWKDGVRAIYCIIKYNLFSSIKE